jgi:hypothetical protein
MIPHVAALMRATQLSKGSRPVDIAFAAGATEAGVEKPLFSGLGGPVDK